MSDTATPAGRPTRRQFVKTVAGTAVGAITAPAIVRGRNLNDICQVTRASTRLGDTIFYEPGWGSRS